MIYECGKCNILIRLKGALNECPCCQSYNFGGILQVNKNKWDIIYNNDLKQGANTDDATTNADKSMNVLGN